MVRLVFRPYTRVGRSICTSEPRRSSTRVSSGFNLPGHSSPSFGSRHARSSSLQPARWRLEGPAVRSRGGGRSRLGIDEQLLCFRCALGFTSPSDLRARHTPRSVTRTVEVLPAPPGDEANESGEERPEFPRRNPSPLGEQAYDYWQDQPGKRSRDRPLRHAAALVPA